ncbi:DUF4403 family protein [Oryzomonas rubra]|uniref:DUF4403 family protein n=1 Tax=Oryzomonas rubra TaxID=2509454 RepID=A0A5A9XFE2_9BACT|nr:DUF4403 family protein [Oryzomonas rubra]KAA0890391.1 DUF4403 family protein [Oryzomonas rubra]
MISKKCIASPVILLLLALSLSSCAGVKTLTAERPQDEAFRTVLRRDVSTLNVPVEATAEELARVLNQTVHKELYKGATGTSGLTADVRRNGPISVSAANNYLYVTLPVAMSLNYGMFGTPAIPVTLKFKATAGITPDWRLHAEIYYQGLSDLVTEEVGIGPLSFKPRSIVEGITQPLQRVVSDLVNKKINDLIPVKALVARVWNSARQPVLLDKSRSVWLKLTPREVVFCPLSARNNKVRLSVGISTFAELVVGPEPATQPLPPLPNLKLVNTFDRTFRIALNTDLFYKDLRAIAAPLLRNKQFDSDGKSIVIKDFDLYGNGDKLVIKLETQGSLDGVFYLTAKPVYDPKTNVFSVEDVDFDMQTQSLLLQSADWFLHGTIRGVIQDKLNMNLNRQLEQSRQMAGKALARVPLMDHVFLTGDVKDLKFGDVIMQKDRISLQVYTEGESAILFQ